MEKRRVVITGLGTVNPLGNNVADSWAAARAGKCGIGPITQFDTTDFKCKLAGEVKDFDPESVVDKKEVRKMARFTLLALGAAAEAIADSGLDTEAEGKDIGVILSSGIGGLPTIEEQHARGEEKGMEKVSPYFVPMAIANMAAAQVAIRFGLKGMCTCPVTACAGGTNAVGDAFHRIRDGYEPVMVCGGAESCISPLGIGGFTSMKALSTATDPDAASLPFDARRGGFVMGEGSGVLVLEELEHARARGAHIYAEVVGYGANCDAYHFTAPAPGGAGAIDCMTLTLADAAGDIAVAECSPEGMRVERPGPAGPFVCAANLFHSDLAVPLPPGLDSWRAAERYDTMRRVLEREGETLALSDVQALLAGRKGFLCQYDRAAGRDTVWSAACDLTRRRCLLAEGNPGRTAFREIPFPVERGDSRP